MRGMHTKADAIEEEAAYTGDDLPDIPLAQRTGLAIGVSIGAPELKAICHFTTRRVPRRNPAREVVRTDSEGAGRPGRGHTRWRFPGWG